MLGVRFLGVSGGLGRGQFDKQASSSLTGLFCAQMEKESPAARSKQALEQQARKKPQARADLKLRSPHLKSLRNCFGLILLISSFQSLRLQVKCA